MANQGACVSYGAQGGTLATFTTSTTSHVTLTRVDLATIQAYFTRVIGYANGTLAYDVTLTSPPASAETLAAFQQATDAVASALAGGSGQILISPPSLVSSSQTSETVFVGEQFDHAETSTTTTTTAGPVAGTVTINTNTHTESFVNQLYQTTVTTFSTYVLVGTSGH